MSTDMNANAKTIVQKPTYDDIDHYGLTHPGKVRKENQDHFLIGSLAKQMLVERSSLSAEEEFRIEPDRLASIAMVADGVGGSGGGEEASRLALKAVSQYVAKSTHAFYTSDVNDPEEFSQTLADAALMCHADLQERAAQEPERRQFATTLTLWLGFWPDAYLLQVGDSRCYMYHEDRLTQISRDQTMAEDLIDKGVLTRTDAGRSRWAHVLSSAIGGREAAPTVTRVTRDWGSIILLCSDGLTKHVSDERIAEHLAGLESAQKTCEALLEEALEDGGSDNITILIGRTVKRDGT